MLLDILFGLILGLFSNFTFGTPDSLFFALFFGVFCSLVPDIDFFVYLFRNKFKIDQFAHEHRDLLHKPIFFLFLGIPLFLFSPEIGLIWIVGTLYHLLHDTIDGGWGIMWLYPLSQKYYTLVKYSPKKIIATKEEQHALALQYGDPHWFQKEITINTRLIMKISLIFVIIIITILAI